jgi:glycosidase
MKNNKLSLRQTTIYQIYPRGYSETHNFDGILKDIKRIKDLGIDYIYLTPIHPIGVLNRKGTYGSPYSISNYMEINKDYGTFDNFLSFVNTIHDNGLKLMIDIVFNHTSRDSFLVKTHPDWFFYDKDGVIYNRIGDWSDVADINYNKESVYLYLTNVLIHYAKYVDGFRFDVASLIPTSFFKYAFPKVKKINKNIIFLAESVDYGFVKSLRDRGFACSSDSELFEYFDILYDYDCYPLLDEYIKNNDISLYLHQIYNQSVIYKESYVKLHFLDNHDQDRIAGKLNDINKLYNITALSFFLKGTGFIYMGQEYMNTKRIDFFENDMVDFNNNNEDFYNFVVKLINYKKNPFFNYGIFNIINFKNPVITYTYNNHNYYGIFNCIQEEFVEIPLPDGIYTNILFNEKVIINNAKSKSLLPIIIEC